MKPQFKLHLIASLFFSLITFGTAQSVDITGDWDLNIISPHGENKAKLTVRKDGENLAGTITGRQGSYPVDVTVKDDEVKLLFTIKYEGSDMRIALTGGRKGETIEGKADFGGQADGTWTAARATAEQTDKSDTSTSTQDKLDVTGTWSFEVQTDAGGGSPVFTFKQQGEQLTGQYKGFFGEAPVTGAIHGREIAFSFKVSFQGTEGTASYKGVVDQDGTMKGTATLGDLGSAKWSAKRKQ
ncbi:MAG TPA: hypothetical protein VGL91_25060 [Acidobacteriota bacterium]|jgi:hypothetical protein